jgi:DNA (cytosine-5)-methyltransferase 3A
MIKLLIGGSPCTHWSIAQKNGRETKPEGLGWELFKNYLIAKEKFKPDYFLYENNKSAAQAIKDQISEELGVPIMHIDSALVSAQSRKRFYAFNWEVEQPEDRGIILRDILESGENLSSNEKSYALTTRCSGAIPEDTIRRRHTMVAEPIRVGEVGKGGQGNRIYSVDGKSVAQTANSGGLGSNTGLYAEPIENVGECETIKKAIPKLVDKFGYVPEQFNAYNLAEITDKSPTLSTGSMVTSSCATTRFEKCDEPIRIGDIGSTAQAHRVYSCDGKSVSLKAQAGGQGAKTGLYACPGTGFEKNVYLVENGLITIKDKQYPIKLADGLYIIRKLTVKECCRLQTLPDDYCRAVSNSQAYKGLGNGWTAEVIIHILNGVLKDVPRDEEIVVLSMYDGIGTGRYCLDEMGFTNVKYYAYEIDKYAKQVAMSNYPDIIQCGDAFDLRHPDWTIGY